MSKKTFSVFGGTNREHLISALVPVISIILALVIGAIIIACLGKNPIKGYA
ncbi:MAG: ABC transporter permease, partial [Lancefieldella rimae]|nr:ABC transporter permease [Lancefieldella rimae]